MTTLEEIFMTKPGDGDDQADALKDLKLDYDLGFQFMANAICLRMLQESLLNVTRGMPPNCYMTTIPSM